MKWLKFLMAGLASLAMASPALAAYELTRPGGNAWQMTVYGNGQVVHDLMVGTSLIMKGDSFTILTLFLATVSFFIMAVGAGFDPARNFLKMFTYFFVIFAVSLGSNLGDKGVVMNVFINDKVNSSVVLTYNPLVQGVPMLIAFPAVLTSEVGRFFTEEFETNFLTPNGFNAATFGMSGGSAGQFNLFNRMVQDAQEFRITNPELQRSVSAYITDCAIPAMARGQLSMNELTTSTNLNDTLSKAAHNSIMTRYYFTDRATASEVSSAVTGLSAEGQAAITAATNGALPAAGSGIIMSCADSYAAMNTQMTQHAKFLLDASATAWRKTGVQVPFATAMDVMLQNAGSSTGATPGSPASFIKQQAFLNQLDPAMRTAAVQTGNNALMQSAAIAQAEQSQKSSWVSGFALFNNMMGYVFTVLQAFIFAVTPMIVVALLIPGFGSAIFKNYAQILLWLTLWEPMLSLINYIITSFAMTSASSALVDSGSTTTALNKANNWILSERTNTLTIAAQFLGTMVPMITWGIVKGAMAFTEFISHGIGSSFASTAGAAAATGSLSWNNSQMNNFSANKLNAAMSASVGYQETSSFFGVGSNQSTFQAGGSNATANASAISSARENSAQLQQQQSDNTAIQKAFSTVLGQSHSMQEAETKLAQHLQGSQLSTALNILHGHAAQVGKSGSTSESADKSTSAGTDKGTEDSRGAGTQVNAGVKGSLSILPGAVSADGGISRSDNQRSEVTSGTKASTQDSHRTSTSSGTNSSVTDSVTTQGSIGRSSNVSNSAGTTRSRSESESVNEALQRSIATTKQISSVLSAAQSVTDKVGYSNSVDMTNARNIMESVNHMQQVLKDKTADFAAQQAAIDKASLAVGKVEEVDNKAISKVGDKSLQDLSQSPEMTAMAAKRAALEAQAGAYGASAAQVQAVTPINTEAVAAGKVAESAAVAGQGADTVAKKAAEIGKQVDKTSGEVIGTGMVPQAVRDAFSASDQQEAQRPAGTPRSQW